LSLITVHIINVGRKLENYNCVVTSSGIIPGSIKLHHLVQRLSQYVDAKSHRHCDTMSQYFRAKYEILTKKRSKCYK
jgi:hypothetical protein